MSEELEKSDIRVADKTFADIAVAYRSAHSGKPEEVSL